MSKKKSFVLRMDDGLFEALEKWASDDFRSVNGQIEWIIHQALRQSGRLPKVKKTDTPPPADREKDPS